MPKEKDKLKKTPSAKQKKFVVEYLKTGNQREAARRAKYSPSMVNNANAIMESDGVKSIMEYIGMTDEFIMEELMKILVEEVNEPLKYGDKLKALRMAGEMSGILGKNERGNNKQVINFIKEFYEN